MAKVLFISVNDITALGVRVLSSCLKSEGHETSILFFKRPGFPYSHYKKSFREEASKIEDYDWVGIDFNGNPYRYSRGPEPTPAEFELMMSHIGSFNPDIIAFSVTTPMVKRIGEISSLIKAHFQVPIIWGGPGATMDSETCVNHSDFVCVGEGERTIIEIAARIDGGKSFHDVNNLCYLDGDSPVSNPLFPLVSDLDELPFLDIFPDNKVLIEDNAITENFAEISYSKRYHMMGSRGCLFKCSYCAEDYYKRLYSSKHFMRRRSPQSVIDELKQALKVVEFDDVQFEDEIFPLEYDWLEEFSKLYKKDIGLPFNCYIYPLRNLEKHIDLLKETGLFGTSLALQSGSERINKDIFHRPFNRDVYIEMAERLDALGIKFYIDVITYNPFEREEDLKATLDVLRHIPKPLAIFINKLYMLKNTTISQLAKESGALKDDNRIPERLFDYYARLFMFTLTENPKLIDFCQKVRVFKYLPSLLRSNRFIVRIRQFVKLVPSSLLS